MPLKTTPEQRARLRENHRDSAVMRIEHAMDLLDDVETLLGDDGSSTREAIRSELIIRQQRAIDDISERLAKAQLVAAALGRLRNEIVEAAEVDTQWEAVARAAGWIDDDGETEFSDVVLDAACCVLHAHTAQDPDPVSMVTDLDQRGEETASVVVIRGREVIEMFRQWGERNKVLHRDRGIDGKPRTP